MQNRFMTITNVFDLIVLMARNLFQGKEPVPDQNEVLDNYTKSELSAAYAWILQKKEEGRFNKTDKTTTTPHRILHFAEQMVITAEAYGFLMELHKLKILSNEEVEAVIDKIMSTGMDVYDLEKIKQIVSLYVTNNITPKGPINYYLRGNESIN